MCALQLAGGFIAAPASSQPRSVTSGWGEVGWKPLWGNVGVCVGGRRRLRWWDLNQISTYTMNNISTLPRVALHCTGPRRPQPALLCDYTEFPSAIRGVHFIPQLGIKIYSPRVCFVCIFLLRSSFRAEMEHRVWTEHKNTLNSQFWKAYPPRGIQVKN